MTVSGITSTARRAGRVRPPAHDATEPAIGGTAPRGPTAAIGTATPDARAVSAASSGVARTSARDATTAEAARTTAAAGGAADATSVLTASSGTAATTGDVVTTAIDAMAAGIGTTAPERRPRDRGREGRRGGRPGEEQRADRPIEPRVPEGITGRELDKDTREELRGLSKETAERVGRHLVSAELLQYSDPETALAHARFAARLGGRVGVVREVHGIFAYHAGDYRTASRELRTAMRITGRTDVLPMIADCERGLGRPERALDIAASEAANDLGVEAAIELMMVVAGAYADTGDVQTALRTLEIPALRHKVDGRWQVRLWVAYADLLERADREDEARRWITLAADADTDGLTDAAERLGRPAPVPAEDPVWEGDEQISVLDAFDPEAEEEPDAAEPTDEGAEEHQESEARDREAQPDEEASPASREEPA